MRPAVILATISSLLLGTGCASAPESIEGEVNIGQPLESLSAEADIPARFSWIVENELAALAHPSTGQGLAWNVQYMVDAGIKLLFTLTVTGLDQSIIGSYPLANVHVPVKDFSAPTREQLEDFVAKTLAELQNGGASAIHCAAGMGRTGTFAAVYLVHKGMTAEQAIDKVRELRPGSIETQAQEDAVKDYAMSIGRVRQ